MKYISAILLLSLSIESMACSIICPTLEWKFNQSNFVFIGTVTKIEPYGLNQFHGEDKIQVYFDVQKQWLGDWNNRALKTVYNRSSCEGYFFEEGKKYILFIKDLHHLSLCDTEVYSEELEQKVDDADKKLKLLKQFPI